MSCATTISNMYKSSCSQSLGQIQQYWLFKSSKSVSEINSLLEETWTTLINQSSATRMYVQSQKPTDVVVEIGEDIYTEGNTGFKEKGKDGKQSLTFTYSNISLCKAQELKNLDGQNMFAYFVTENENILATGNDDDIVTNEVKIFVSEPKPSDATGQGWKVNVRIELVQTTGIWTKSVDPFTANAWRPTQLDGIKDVVFSNIAADISAKTVIFDVTSYCDNIEVIDLTDKTDFVVEVASTGVALTIASVTYNGNTATITVDVGTPLTAVLHNLRLKQQPAMTIKGFESKQIYTFTPVA